MILTAGVSGPGWSSQEAGLSQAEGVVRRFCGVWSGWVPGQGRPVAHLGFALTHETRCTYRAREAAALPTSQVVARMDLLSVQMKVIRPVLSTSTYQ